MSKAIAGREDLVHRVIESFDSVAADQRLIVAIAGAPASGKSTLAEWLVKEINARMPDSDVAVMVPMDGYHLDNAILDARDMLAVKGAPDTFDVNGFHHLLQRLASPLTDLASAQPDASKSIYAPLFDRERDLARCAASEVNECHRIVIVEGNYLLLQRKVWQELAALFDLSVMLDVPRDILEQRLIKRWIDQGMDHKSALARAMSNDLRNAVTVLEESTSADLKLKSVRQ